MLFWQLTEIEISLSIRITKSKIRLNRNKLKQTINKKMKGI